MIERRADLVLVLEAVDVLARVIGPFGSHFIANTVFSAGGRTAQISYSAPPRMRWNNRYLPTN